MSVFGRVSQFVFALPPKDPQQQEGLSHSRPQRVCLVDAVLHPLLMLSNV